MVASLGGTGGFSLQAAEFNFRIYSWSLLIMFIVLVVCVCGYFGLWKYRSSDKENHDL